MAYAGYDDAVALYGEEYVLTSVDRNQDGQDPDAFLSACAMASSHIDSYISVRYDVPISPVSELLKQYTIDIAIYRCSADAGTATEEKRRRYEDALAWCRDVSKGAANLGLPDPVKGVEDGTLELHSNNPTRLFTRSKMSRLL